MTTAGRDREVVRAALARRREAWQQTEGCVDTLAALAGACREALGRGRQIIFFGNGGSASQADHLAAELVGRYVEDRPALSARALSQNGALVTAIANDYGYAAVFSRQLEGVASRGDVVIGLSTSGTSDNVRAALETARRLGCITALLTGDRDRGELPSVDHLLRVPSRETPVIQELHLFCGHLLCELVEAQPRRVAAE